MKNDVELTFEKKKACIYELDKAATEIGNLLGAAVKAAHISEGITKEEFWRNLFIAKGTHWNAKAGHYMNDQPLMDQRYDDPQRCPADPYREMDLLMWIKYLLDGGYRVISDENGTVFYATDSLSFFKMYEVDYFFRGEYPQHRTMGGAYRGTLYSLKNMRNAYLGHISSKKIEDTDLAALQGILQTMMKILSPLCSKDWAGKKYSVALREAINISFYRSLQEIPYPLSEVLTIVNLEPENVDVELLAKAGIQMEEEMVFLNCDPAYFANMIKSLVQMDVPEEMWIVQLRRTQERKVDEQALLKLSNVNETPLSAKENALNLKEMTPETLQQKAKSGDISAQLALAEYCFDVQKDQVSAFQWWHRAAESGHAGAQCSVGTCYLNACGTSKNAKYAVSWFRKAAEQGDAKAQYHLGVCYANGSGVTKDSAVALSWYQQSAEQGYPDAQYALGVCHDYGRGTDKDPAKARMWYQLAAEQGNCKAQNSFAVMLEEGTAGEQDLNTAFLWYLKAAKQGHSYGQWNAGRCYREGIGTQKDMKEAVVWIRKAAEQGHTTAQLRMGRCCENGDGMDKNPVEAVQWYRKAANAGNVSAQFSLAYCYNEGIGVDVDYERAANWYREAADQGSASAQCNLGFLYEKGTGVPKSLEKAAMWYQKGANNGSTCAQNNLANCYEKGLGVEKNLETALLWTKKALLSNDVKQVKRAQLRYDRISKMISKE